MKKTMLSILAAAMLLAAVAIPSQADYPAMPMVDSKTREARRAKLEQMAVLVGGLSLGKSKLMLKSAASASPGGRPMRTDGEFGNPFLTVYPVSIPVNARLLIVTPDNGVVRQYGRILGAVEVITSVESSGGKREAEPGAHLLFAPINGPMTPELPLWLVSVKVDEDGKVTFTAAADSTVKITPSKLGDDAPSPTVTASIDFTKAAVAMTWGEQTYTFGFQMRIIYV